MSIGREDKIGQLEALRDARVPSAKSDGKRALVALVPEGSETLSGDEVELTPGPGSTRR